MEQRPIRATDLFEEDVTPAEIARQVGVSHQFVSDWRTVWRQYGRDGLRGAGRAERRLKLAAEQLEQVEVGATPTADLRAMVATLLPIALKLPQERSQNVGEDGQRIRLTFHSP